MPRYPEELVDALNALEEEINKPPEHTDKKAIFNGARHARSLLKKFLKENKNFINQEISQQEQEKENKRILELNKLLTEIEEAADPRTIFQTYPKTLTFLGIITAITAAVAIAYFTGGLGLLATALFGSTVIPTTTAAASAAFVTFVTTVAWPAIANAMWWYFVTVVAPVVVIAGSVIWKFYQSNSIFYQAENPFVVPTHWRMVPLSFIAIAIVLSPALIVVAMAAFAVAATVYPIMKLFGSLFPETKKQKLERLKKFKEDLSGKINKAKDIVVKRDEVSKSENAKKLHALKGGKPAIVPMHNADSSKKASMQVAGTGQAHGKITAYSDAPLPIKNLHDTVQTIVSAVRDKTIEVKDILSGTTGSQAIELFDSESKKSFLTMDYTLNATNGSQITQSFSKMSEERLDLAARLLIQPFLDSNKGDPSKTIVIDLEFNKPENDPSTASSLAHIREYIRKNNLNIKLQCKYPKVTRLQR